MEVREIRTPRSEGVRALSNLTSMRKLLVRSANSSNSVIDRIVCKTPVDPAGGHCYWGSTKPCESRGFGPRRTAQ